MPAPLILLKPQIMAWGIPTTDANGFITYGANGVPTVAEDGWTKITDHNRSEVSITPERLGDSKRMANGTMRQYVIADKRSFDVSWSDLPHNSAWTVDGFAGGREIEAFYNQQVQPFVLRLVEGDGTTTDYFVTITDFSKSIKKRGAYDFWDLDITLEEV